MLALCPWHVPTHFGNVPWAPSRLGSGFMLSRLGDATPRTDQPQPCHSNISPKTFTTVMRTTHAEPTHSGLLRNKSALTTIADAEPTMRKTCQYLSHVEHWYGIPSADRREDADRQIFQPVVTVTQSELWNQRVTVINHISDLSRTNRVDAPGEFTSPKAFINCAINVCFAGENLKHSW